MRVEGPIGRSKWQATLLAFFVMVPLAFAQKASPTDSSIAPAAPLVFDVVSIKPNRSGSPGMIHRASPDSYSVENMVPRLILSDAFGIRPDLISGGPGWIDSDHYDLIAKVASDDLAAYKALSKFQRDQMLQRVLADRFRLAVHTSIKQLPGYTVAIAKGGFKLRPVSDDQRSGWGAGSGEIRATAISIPALCDLLSSLLRQTVVDQTGLTGLYTFHLQWQQDLPRVSASPEAAADPSGLPALPTALEEQLGLKLKPAKFPTTTLVIDHIEKPSEN